MSDYRYDAAIHAIHDGDTITLDVDMGFSLWWRQNIRLFGINAPELNTDAGKAALAHLTGLIPVGSKVELESIKDKPDKYGGRYLGIVRAGGLSVNDLMVQSGHAKVWDGKGLKPV